ncbi:hypothetical protein A7U60_g956 [Sanghuangporus baumii]|uniref:Zn(2)-C6 fungal-type domain-containing protein n=1 Tax=Sanghuangporus baumii TaxID=108892 RepID=A0A9Q5I5C9_SANBA|nr:hypothetical protein A7U60_g956 [Sanghuangporus baumii]
MPPPQRIVRAKDSVEIRRARGEISCAECRRHKLKCDKAIPCSTCVRKGCQSICPNGTLAPTHGTRPSAPDAVAYDTKIMELSNRIRQLEDALQITHSTVSTAPHPLLAEDLLQIKNRAVASTSTKADSDLVDSDLVDSFGTLAITNRGTEFYLGGPSHDFLTVRFYEAVCSKDSLIAEKKHIVASSTHAHADSSSALPSPISYLSKTFPFTPLYLPTREIQEYIEEKLPSYERASSLTEAYLENLSWFFRPVEREQIMGELIPIVYKKRRRTFNRNGSNGSQNGTPGPDSPTDSPTDAHVLALLLAVFAAGAVADLTLPPWNDEADLYHHLARTALSLKPVFEGAGLHAVQAISLIGAYDLFACRKNEMEGAWKILTFSLSIAASIGLNRDPAHFDLSPTLVQRRRRVFWELYAIDIWKASSGRPVTFTPSVIDCELPEDTDADLRGGSDNLDSIWRMQYGYIKEVMSEIVTILNSTRAIKYSEILMLDQKIREYDPQGIFSSNARGYHTDHSVDGIYGPVQLQHLSLMKDITLLLLHRSFFAHALVEDPTNPVRTQFGPSFLSMYRSAASMISNIQREIEGRSHYVMRCWPVLGHTLHATVVLGSIAACGTAAALAPQAFIHFDNALKLFPTLQMHPLSEIAMPLLMRLREQALQALAKHGNEITSQSRSATPSSESVTKNQASHALSSLGRMNEGSFEGGISTTSTRNNNFVHSGLQTMPSGSSHPTQFSVPFSAYPKHTASTTATPSMPGYEPPKSNNYGGQSENRLRQTAEQKTDSDADSEMRRSSDVSTSARRPLSDPRESSMSFSLGGSEASGSNAQSHMQVDQHLYAPMNGNLDGHPFNARAFGLQGSPAGPDVLNTYTTLSDLPTDSNMSGVNFTTETVQTQSTPDAYPLSSDPFAFDSASNLSPETFFNSDFDVSFDMRSSTGQESFLPLLPGDLEAWRAII